ncbi:hypothetical protein [Lederbergia citri]|uniref:Uncharacterized protein n=1 Tax=Lederbergia citri TaxID=2833580 RepID=A0A942TB15_9BACI|nr:hypothetical protein [Lederbergia citri]MBS4194468.1 hypothetical protein [Lederbergia citri]
MTKKEIIERLESISSQIDHLEKMVEEKSAQKKQTLYKKMDFNEKQLERNIRKLELSYDENNERKTFSKAI